MNLPSEQNALTLPEAQALTNCEAVIERGLAVFQEVGLALMNIRDQRLYRADYGTFEEYCDQRWGMQRRHAYRLMDAATVVQNVSNWTQNANSDLGTNVPTLPANEAQARPLTLLPREQQGDAWREALETAPNGKVTAQHVNRIVNARRARVGSFDPDEEYGREYDDEATVATDVGGEEDFQPSGSTHGVPAALQMSTSNEWYTPAKYIEAARAVLGGFDLDPASCEYANRVVQAAIFFDETTDGLARSWYGRVWMNPPYGRDGGESNQALWSAKLIAEYQAGNVTEAVMLVNAVTDRVWFQPLWNFPICFTDHRIRFYNEQTEAGQPTHGNAFVYFGENVGAFAREFAAFGRVVVPQGTVSEARHG